MMAVGGLYQVHHALRWYVDSVQKIAELSFVLRRISNYRSALERLPSRA